MLFKRLSFGKAFFLEEVSALLQKAVMRIDIITLFPELLQSPFEASIVKRALQGGKAEIHFHNPAITAVINTSRLMTTLMAVAQVWS